MYTRYELNYSQDTVKRHVVDNAPNTRRRRKTVVVVHAVYFSSSRGDRRASTIRFITVGGKQTRNKNQEYYY